MDIQLSAFIRTALLVIVASSLGTGIWWFSSAILHWKPWVCTWLMLFVFGFVLLFVHVS